MTAMENLLDHRLLEKPTFNVGSNVTREYHRVAGIDGSQYESYRPDV